MREEGLQQEKRTEEADKVAVRTAEPKNKKDDSTATQESTQETSKSTQEMILDEIHKHSFTTREQLAKVVGITHDGIKKQLDKQKKANRIKHVGPTKRL